MIELLKDPTLWFPAAIALAVAVTAFLAVRLRAHGVPRRARVTRLLHAFYGCTIGMMGTGHVVAVTIRAVEGTLSDGMRWFLYPLGLLFAVPGWLLVATTTPRRLAVLDAILVVALIFQGPSAPLAIPAILNLIYLRYTGPRAERAVVVASMIVYATLFAISLVMAIGG